MDTNLILQLIGLVLINAISNTLGTLTIFNTKRYMKPTYILTFLDAIIFATVMKQISSGDGIYFILAYAVGKLIGVYFADIIEKKMAFGILEIDFYLNDKEKMIQIADFLRDMGYSVNTTFTYGYGGAKRYRIEVTMLRKELPILEEVLRKFDYNEPTLSIKEVSKVKGKISLTRNHQLNHNNVLN